MDKNIPEIPSIKEAAIIAGMFDDAGYYKDADLMDTFIKRASNIKLEKQAGLWSGIWNRLSGWAKRLFFKEYRELYRIAKEANAKVEQRFEEAKELWKEAQSDFKNYELVAWREKILKLPVITKDLMGNYEEAFGRLVAFTYKLQEKEEKEEDKKGIMGITPPSEGGEIGSTVSEDKKDISPEEKKNIKLENEKKVGDLGEDWHYAGVKSLVKNELTDDVAIELERFERSKKWGQFIYGKKQKNLIKINPNYKGKLAEGLEDLLGNNIWKIKDIEKGWVILEKYQEEPEITETKETEKIETPLVPPNIEEIKTEEPKIESPKETKTEEPKIIEQIKKPEGFQRPENLKWVVYLLPPNEGKVYLRGKGKFPTSMEIKDDNLIQKLDMQANKEYGLKADPKAITLEDPEGEYYGIPKESFNKAQLAALKKREQLKAKRKERKEEIVKTLNIPEQKEPEETLVDDGMNLSKLFDSLME